SSSGIWCRTASLHRVKPGPVADPRCHRKAAPAPRTFSHTRPGRDYLPQWTGTRSGVGSARVRRPPVGEQAVHEERMSLEGRVAIVTGAGTVGPGVGVGKATSLVLARQGINLVLLDVDRDRVAETEALVKAEDGTAVVCVGSVANPEDCKVA